MQKAGRNNTTVLVLSIAIGAIFLGIVGFLGWLILGRKKTKTAGCHTSEQCGAGYICDKMECIPFDPPEPPPCVAGAEVKDCNCWPPLARRTENGHELCVKSDVIAACAAPEVQKALKSLVSDCIKNGGQGLSCKPADWQQFAIKNETFDQVMSNFPGAITVHFPSGRPMIGDNFVHWPPPLSFTHYVDVLRPNKKAFDEAKRIFVIGRASRGGASPEQNLKFGQERMDFARRLLVELYKEEGDAGRDAMSRKILNFTLGQERQIEASFFEAYFLPHAITWDDVSAQDFSKTLKARKTASEDKKVWAVGVMNQVAFVVPIPCDGSEGD